jgi:eukaryotic-like serine/threonine-protein kinase
VLRSLAFPRGVPALNTDAAGSAPPDAFGPFRVLHQIGAGVLGPVFRAYHQEQNRLVAIKLFKLDLPPERVHQLVADLETLIAIDLSHPAIAAPIATGIVDNTAFLALDFVAADSLDVVIRESGSAAAIDVLRVASPLADALDTGAALGALHGALHPRDVLVTADDVRMTGIGISAIVERAGVAAPVRRRGIEPPTCSASARWCSRC